VLPADVCEDDPNVCPKCLDAGVVVFKFGTAEEYCRHYGIEPGEMTRAERYGFDRAEAGGYKLRFAVPCNCADFRARQRRFNAAVRGLSRELKAARFEGVHRHIAYKVEAARAARKLVDTVIAGEGGVLIFEGETGAGKTYLAVAAVRAVTDAKRTAAFSTSQEFCFAVEGRAISVEGMQSYVDGFRDNDLVVIDDFGNERIKPGGVVEGHYVRLLRSFERGGALLITTNYDFEEKLRERFGDEADPIARRLADVQVAPNVRFGGQGSMPWTSS